MFRYSIFNVCLEKFLCTGVNINEAQYLKISAFHILGYTLLSKEFSNHILMKMGRTLVRHPSSPTSHLSDIRISGVSDMRDVGQVTRTP